jgi:hypothetical protein
MCPQNKNDDSEYEILAGHAKQGSRFVSYPNLSRPVSHARHTVPELIWLAQLNEQLGIRDTARIAETIGLAVRRDKYPISIMFLTSLAELSEEDSQRVQEALDKNKLLNSAKTALAQLTGHYPHFPVKWLRPESDVSLENAFLPAFKKALADLLDKSARRSVLMIAQAVYGFTAAGCLPASIDDFEEVLKYPDTEKSKAVASSVRSINMLMVSLNIVETQKLQWSNYFWQRGLELEPVDYANLLRGINDLNAG